MKKISFEVASCSSFDQDFAPNELLVQNHNPMTKGWQSSRFCVYPQVITIKLTPGNCIIRKIQMLAHHFKISTKVEVQIGKMESSLSTKLIQSEYDSIDYEKLGFVTFSDNFESGYRARELKSINLEAEGSHLRFLIHKCHINSLNLYNQVGIVAINVIGEPRDSDYFINSIQYDSSLILMGFDPHSDDPAWDPTHDNKHAVCWGLMNKKNEATIDDLAFDIYRDREIAKMISAVVRTKEEALKNENYVLAKALKTLLDLCEKAGKECARLDVTKTRAVDTEDYDTANALKADIERLKYALMAKMRSLGLKLNQDGTIVAIQDASSPPVINELETDLSVDRPRSEPEIDTAIQSIKEFPPKTPILKATQVTSTTNLLSGRVNVDETTQSTALQNIFDPRPLSEQQKEDFRAACSLFGDYLVACLLDKQFKLREWALNELAKKVDVWKDEISNSQAKYQEEFIDAIFSVIATGLDDSREKVLILTIGLWDQVTRLFSILNQGVYIKHKVPEKFSFYWFDKLIPALFLKSTDMNPRIKTACMDFFIQLGTCHHSVPYSVLPFVLQPFSHRNSSQVHWRQIKSRLQILNRVLSEFGLDGYGERKKTKKLGINMEVCKFCNKSPWQTSVFHSSHIITQRLERLPPRLLLH